MFARFCDYNRASLSLKSGLDVLDAKASKPVPVFHNDSGDSWIGKQLEQLRPFAIQTRTHFFDGSHILQSEAAGEGPEAFHLAHKIGFLIVRRHTTVQDGLARCEWDSRVLNNSVVATRCPNDLYGERPRVHPDHRRAVMNPVLLCPFR